jgi:predicted dehydrogenase
MVTGENLLRTVVVGGGKAGGRFLRALRYADCASKFDVVGLVDIDSTRLSGSAGTHGCYTDLVEALRREVPEVVVVCVNEEYHFEVLRTVLATPSIKHVVCEKPLTRTLEEFELLAPNSNGIPISVNFCERYSPVLDDCLAWLALESVEITRAEFWWGKYRIRDSRPTMGVLSELTHPLDLVRYLLGAEADAPFRLESASSTNSDFSSFSDSVSDSVSVVGDIAGCLVLGTSSFVWEERRRRLVLYGRSQYDGRTWQLVLDFDNPCWDNDTFSVYELEPNGGRRVETRGTAYRAADLPPEVRYVDKIYRYLLDVADSVTSTRSLLRGAEVMDAYWVQKTLDDIARLSARPGGQASARLFASRAQLTDQPLTDQPLTDQPLTDQPQLTGQVLTRQ